MPELSMARGSPQQETSRSPTPPATSRPPRMFHLVVLMEAAYGTGDGL